MAAAAALRELAPSTATRPISRRARRRSHLPCDARRVACDRLATATRARVRAAPATRARERRADLARIPTGAAGAGRAASRRRSRPPSSGDRARDAPVARTTTRSASRSKGRAAHGAARSRLHLAGARRRSRLSRAARARTARSAAAAAGRSAPGRARTPARRRRPATQGRRRRSVDRLDARRADRRRGFRLSASDRRQRRRGRSRRRSRRRPPVARRRAATGFGAGVLRTGAARATAVGVARAARLARYRRSVPRDLDVFAGEWLASALCARAGDVALARHLAAAPPERRHQLRIQLKKLRYAAEFTSSLFPGKQANRYARRLAAL